MALIKCTECGKEISDKAAACPHCGCPILSSSIPSPSIEAPPKKKGHGCLVSIIIVFLLFCFGLSVGLSQGRKVTNPKQGISNKYIDVTDEEGELIDNILSKCGISEVSTFEHDELLDNAHFENETGYRISIKDTASNIILYLDVNKNVYSLKYAGYDLYINDSVVATIDDYTVSIDEINKYQYYCQEAIKEILKSPSTAKFPIYTEWGWKQEKDILYVQGYVDAQNSFGAELRSNFELKIDMTTDTITSFIFDGQELLTE